MIAKKIRFLFLTFLIFQTKNKIVTGKETTGVKLEIPKNFLIGSATSAYQIEGAWSTQGKAENNWDHLVHNYPEKIVDRSNGDISCDSFNNYKKDIELLNDIGLDFYRFSLSWTRILPFGNTSVINREGVKYYHKLLDELEKYKIIPFVTIYHFDHPQKYDEEFGGWLDEKMAYEFANYARFVFQEYGPRVKFFSTINEPQVFCSKHLDYFNLLYGKNLTGWGEYHCVHNMLKGHALAYRIYDKEFRKNQNGQIGVINACGYSYNKFKKDLEANDIAYEFDCGWTANPIFSKNGDYPKIMKHRIAERSRLQGYNVSRLPTFSEYWVDLMKGTYDYFGLNHYSSDLVESLSNSEILNWPNDEGLTRSYDPMWETAQSEWLKIVPEGLGNLLRKIKSKYDNPPVYILENGVSDGNGTTDNMRMNYIYSYVKEVLTAMYRDGCDVRSYSYWSLLDNFEWRRGFTIKFGLYEVNFEDVNRTRTPKKSVEWFKKMVKTRKLEQYSP